MVSVHHGVAFVVIATCFVAAATGGWAYFRRTEPRGYLTHALALAQTFVIAQAAIGLLLLSSHHHAMDKLHYLYGGVALIAVLSPWMYAPAGRRRRLAWFTGAPLLAGAPPGRGVV